MTIANATRNQVVFRAEQRCEYCLLHQNYSAKKHEVDHIIPLKHGGKDSVDNLAWACFHCNRYKGSEVGAFSTETGQLTPLFNPRKHIWDEHFVLDRGMIAAQTEIGRVTVMVLQLNRPARIQVRVSLMKAGLYP